MTLPWALLYGLIIIAATAAVAWSPWLTGDHVLRSLERQRLLVFTVDGSVFDGLLVRRDRKTLIFIDVHSRSTGVPIPATPGEFGLPRPRMAYFQRLSSDGALTLVPEPAQDDATAA
jgi:hypothetical protein